MRTLDVNYHLRKSSGRASRSSAIGPFSERSKRCCSIGSLCSSDAVIGSLRSQDSVWSWVVCFAAFSSCAITQGLHGSFGLIYVALLKNFGQSKAATAWVGSGALAIACLLSPLVGLLCTRYGCRLVTIFGGLTCAVGLFLTAHAPSLPIIYLTYSMIFGFGASCSYTSAFIAVTDYFSKWRSLATGIACAGSSVGILVMTRAIQSLLQHLGWESTFMVMSAVSLSLCVFGCTYDPSIRLCAGSADRISENTRLQPEQKKCASSLSLLDFSVWRIPAFAVYAVSMAVIMLGYFAPRAHLARYCEDLGITVEESSWFYFFIGLSSLFGRIFFGQLCNFRVINAFYVTQLSAITIGVTSLLLPLARSRGSFVAYSVVIGFFDGGVNTPIALLVYECVGRHRMPAGWGFLSFATGITICVGPPIAGFMADAFGSYEPSLYTAGGVVLLGAFLLSLRHCSTMTSTSLSFEEITSFNICEVEKSQIAPNEALNGSFVEIKI
ncbi:monocarboxylate transporter 10 isoform X1 [Nematostella vectensis]|uniref:monocarboxylate transporter 10 isoform X1 n=1 Tax=Nematostella vectensis TaxID=45351 RepID=UPI002076FEC4|nr:monocarboxylate transporter 10 isoform X1 [Nematostella vectensis]